MTATPDRLAAALADRYRLERELGQMDGTAVTCVYAGNPHANYDVMPDGKRFVFPEAAGTGDMVGAANWAPVVRARVAQSGGR